MKLTARVRADRANARRSTGPEDARGQKGLLRNALHMDSPSLS